LTKRSKEKISFEKKGSIRGGNLKKVKLGALVRQRRIYPRNGKQAEKEGN